MADPIKKITLKDGTVRYRFVVDVGRDENGKRKQVTVTRDTKKEAVAERGRLLHERSTGQLIAPSETTVGEWADQWAQKRAADVEESTAISHRNKLVHIHAYLGHLPIQELTEDHVESFVAWLLVNGRRRGGTPGTGLRPSTVDGILGLLRDVLDRAVVRRLVAVNVAKHVTVPRRARKEDRRANPRVKPWNVVEVKDFLLGIREDRLLAPLLLSLMGLRPSEVAGQRWDRDVDLTSRLITIDTTRTMIGNSYTVEKDAKTTASERTLPLPACIAKALAGFRAIQEAERSALHPYYKDTGYVLVDHTGEPMDTRQLREYAYAIMDRLGLRKVRLYDARHSCLTFLAMNGVPDKILAAWAGHVDAAFTKRVYVHPDPEDLRVASDHLETLLGLEEVSVPAGRENQ